MRKKGKKVKGQSFVRIRLDSDLLRRANKQAKAESRTTASLFRYAVMSYLATALDPRSGK